jgi:hypothetical protein
LRNTTVAPMILYCSWSGFPLSCYFMLMYSSVRSGFKTWISQCNLGTGIFGYCNGAVQGSSTSRFSETFLIKSSCSF